MEPNVSSGFRDPARLAFLQKRIVARLGSRQLSFMHVCGTHEHAIGRFGLRGVLPPGLRVIAGPGCPVCICPPQDIAEVVTMALEYGVTIATFGDMVGVPGHISYAEARTRGANVAVLYGPADAVALATAHPARQVVLHAVGFETTACVVAAMLKAGVPENLSVYVSHRLVPPALEALVAMDGPRCHGFLLPGHAITVSGTDEYIPLARKCGVPMVVAGFEPVDILLGMDRLVELALSEDPGRVDNAYPRAVRTHGNVKANETMREVFDTVDGAWRGLGVIPRSAQTLSTAYKHLDARQRFPVKVIADVPDCLPGCSCGDVMLGRIEPEDCALFKGGACSPDAPQGPCMVSSEGTCRSRYIYRSVQ